MKATKIDPTRRNVPAAPEAARPLTPEEKELLAGVRRRAAERTAIETAKEARRVAQEEEKTKRLRRIFSQRNPEQNSPNSKKHSGKNYSDRSLCVLWEGEYVSVWFLTETRADLDSSLKWIVGGMESWDRFLKPIVEEAREVCKTNQFPQSSRLEKFFSLMMSARYVDPSPALRARVFLSLLKARNQRGDLVPLTPKEFFELLNSKPRKLGMASERPELVPGA